MRPTASLIPRACREDPHRLRYSRSDRRLPVRYKLFCLLLQGIWRSSQSIPNVSWCADHLCGCRLPGNREARQNARPGYRFPPRHATREASSAATHLRGATGWSCRDRKSAYPREGRVSVSGDLCQALRRPWQPFGFQKTRLRGTLTNRCKVNGLTGLSNPLMARRRFLCSERSGH